MPFHDNSYKTKIASFYRQVDANHYLHRCNVLYWLAKLCANTESVVVTDSYFESVPVIISLKEAGLRFIGVLKTVTKEYTMHYLGALELHISRQLRRIAREPQSLINTIVIIKTL